MTRSPRSIAATRACTTRRSKGGMLLAVTPCGRSCDLGKRSSRRLEIVSLPTSPFSTCSISRVAISSASGRAACKKIPVDFVDRIPGEPFEVVVQRIIQNGLGDRIPRRRGHFRRIEPRPGNSGRAALRNVVAAGRRREDRQRLGRSIIHVAQQQKQPRAIFAARLVLEQSTQQRADFVHPRPKTRQHVRGGETDVGLFAGHRHVRLETFLHGGVRPRNPLQLVGLLLFKLRSPADERHAGQERLMGSQIG
jgi:hypothetical protein